MVDFLHERKVNEEILSIMNILMNANAVTCEPIVEPTIFNYEVVYEIPVGYTVCVDFKKLAKSLYNHGCRLEKGDIHG